MKGRIVYVCYESVADSMREALRAEQGIDEFQVSLDVAAYALLERRWISKGESSGNHMLYSSALFAETEISENDPPASYWMQRIEQTEVERERELRETFFYGRPRFTYFFLVIIIALFILMELSGGSQNPRVLLFFGAKYTPLILEGEWWRFITPMFLHIGLMHILFNGFALYSLGTLTEQLYGSVRYFIIYMLAGISGVVGSFAFSPNLSAGASGAIFGLFGALLYFGTQNKSLFFQTLGTNILVVLGINLAIGFLSPQIIDNYAHLGGLIGGFLASAIVGLPRKKGNPFIKAGAFILLAVLIWWGMKRGGL
ncbi:rhomboid family intramembrane serine protease [Aneurinibacillus thermoaerophilus]|nr:rhomboid family intramembrane serine protease [Aneurinibacillus thermoaerophilus]